MKLNAQTKLLFIGDSITDAGRSRLGEPTPWNVKEGLGSGYVALVEALLTARCPELGIRIVNRGISGNTVPDLEARWQADVLDLEPDWLSIMIGINDVWRQFDSPLRKEIHVRPDRYRRILESLVEKTVPTLKHLVLMTPYMIEPNRQEPMRAMMDEYGAIVAELAAKHGATLVDTQAEFDRVMRHVHPMTLAGDRIHPGPAGHMVLALAFLRAAEVIA